MSDASASAALDETADGERAFPRLSDEALEVIGQHATPPKEREGEILYREGDDAHDFWVVLAGKVAIVADLARADERVIGVHGARRFLDELNLLTGERST